ncbi:hypothetical protein PHMEG_0004291 [Phytophthora megakarya]|uniref:Uncharacterized protein n=1 Tax=Phytophthora megakarya TaxID=4795 RepID=A0A225WVS7_9STRA|nr:hypothetical protein PHMEG_0004291 [Phytophthora megakarya]
MSIRLYTGIFTKEYQYWLNFSYTQKCYTFNSCMKKNKIAADWQNVHHLAIVFYEDEDCQGEKLISHALPEGDTMFEFKRGAKSFMVWSDGMYATRGIYNECMDRESINATNTTVSGSAPQMETSS